MKGKKNFSIFGGHSRKKVSDSQCPPCCAQFFFCRQLQYMHRKKTFFLHCTWQWTCCESLSTPLKVIQLRTRADYKYHAYQKVHYQDGQPGVMDQDSGAYRGFFALVVSSNLLQCNVGLNPTWHVSFLTGQDLFFCITAPSCHNGTKKRIHVPQSGLCM